MNPFSSSSPVGSDTVSPTSLACGDTTLATMIPNPLDYLQIPPFLSKTFDMVDDPVQDPIISWSISGQSFIVWDPVEFSRIIAPRNFKHNNFSSFVRQLNTYGFRKINPDKWEFANQSFLRGHKNLLKNIQRRKGNHSVSTNNFSANEEVNNLEAEIQRLHKEKTEMMQQVTELNNRNHETRQNMESINQKLEAAEKKHKQMVLFLGKAIQNPTLMSSLTEKRKQMLRVLSPRTSVKFVKHQTDHLNLVLGGGSSRNFDHEDGELKGKNVVDVDEIIVKQEDIWSDFENYELAEFGVEGDGELPEFRSL